MLVLDASGSMWGCLDGEFKIRVVCSVVEVLLEDWNPVIHLGLVVYGYCREGDCADIETLIELSLSSVRMF